MTHRFRAISAGLLAAAALSLTATPAAADVLEIDEQGNVTVHAPQRAAPVATPVSTPRRSDALSPLFAEASALTQVSAELIEAVAWTESRFNVAAVSPKGARGVMQLMPGTARMLGVDANDPAQNIRGGAAYLADMLRQFGGDVVLALAAYNAGPGAVRRHGGVPPYAETQAYVEKVLSRLAAQAEASR